MSLPTDPTTQLQRLVELNTEIAEARAALATANQAALDASATAGAAQLELDALTADRDELLESMKHYTSPELPPFVESV